MKILFWYYKSRKNKKGLAPVRMRVTINGERADITTGIEIQEEKWDIEDQRIKGTDELANQYNSILMTLRTLAWECYNHSLRNYLPLNVDLIKANILAKDKPNYTLVDALDFQIANLKARVGNDVAYLTVKKYETIKRKVLDYLDIRLKRKDILLAELSNKFIFDFDTFLRTKDADISKLNRQHLMKDEEGNMWIILSRTKTKSQSLIPVLWKSSTFKTGYCSNFKTERGGTLDGYQIDGPFYYQSKRWAVF